MIKLLKCALITLIIIDFILSLFDEIKRLEKTEFYIDSIQKAAIETHKHNLSKYKEIIGVSNENNMGKSK